VTTITFGNNLSGPASAYTERNLYDGVAFMDSLYQEQIDFRMFHLFGKVDTRGNPILLPRKKFLLSSGLIKRVPKTDVYTFSFLEPAIKDMTDRFVKDGYLSIRNQISEDSTFASLQPRKSLVFWEDEYEQHVENLRQGFLEFFEQRYREQDIKTFSNYINVFEDFVSETTPYSVFTLKSYLVSRFCDPMISGMFVEFASDDASDDEGKFKNYILDTAYPKLLTEAAFNGLIVDKHVPWRFAINPNSAEMLQTLKDAGYKSFSNFIDNVYIDPTAVNFELFTKMVIDIYRKLTYDQPQYLKLSYVGNNPSLTVEDREKILVDNCHPLFDRLGMEKTLRLYCSVRMREANIFATQDEFNGKVQIALNYQKSLDLRTSIMYIDKETSVPDLENTKKPEFRI